MPWTAAQHRLFEWVKHHPAQAHREGVKISQKDAARMAGEGVKKTGRHAVAHALSH